MGTFNYVQEGEKLKVTAPAGGFTAWTPAVVNNRLLVPTKTVAEGESCTAIMFGVFEAAKAAVTILAFERAYYDADAAVVTNVATRADGATDALATAEVDIIDPVATPVVANTVKTYLQYVPAGHIIDSLAGLASVTPASAGGAITLAGAKVGGNNILDAATFDLEGLIGGTQGAIGVTATEADRTFATAGWIKWTVTSDNADATGGADLNILTSLRPTTLDNLEVGYFDGAGYGAGVATANVKLLG